jgi:transposase
VRCQGRPLGFVLTPGQAHDIQGFGPLFRMIADRIEALLADKGYDADALDLPPSEWPIDYHSLDHSAGGIHWRHSPLHTDPPSNPFAATKNDRTPKTGSSIRPPI